MIALLLALGCPKPPPPASEADVPVSPAPTCIVTWRRTSGPSILSEQRESGAPAWSDFATSYPSRAIGATHVPVKHVERFQVGGRPVLYFTSDHGLAVVDASAFSDLQVADATALGDSTVVIGTVTPAARAALGDRGVVELLVEADAIRIYAHVEGEVCLTEEASEGGAYRARFSGEHTYFTNQQNTASMSFEVRIAPGGAMTVARRD